MSNVCKADSSVGRLGGGRDADQQLIIIFVMQAGNVESRAGAVTEGGVQGQGYQLGMTPSSAGACATTLHLLACCSCVHSIRAVDIMALETTDFSSSSMCV